jgi:hypothetical protein
LARSIPIFPELSAYVQVHPYSAGCETSVCRLAPNVTVASRTTEASIVPKMADRTGTRPRSAPGSRASRTPSAAAAGRPIAQAARTIADPAGAPSLPGRPRAAARCGARRYAITAATADSTQTSSAKPAPRTVQSNATPRNG